MQACRAWTKRCDRTRMCLQHGLEQWKCALQLLLLTGLAVVFYLSVDVGQVSKQLIEWAHSHHGAGSVLFPVIILAMDIPPVVLQLPAHLLTSLRGSGASAHRPLPGATGEARCTWVQGVVGLQVHSVLD